MIPLYLNIKERRRILGLTQTDLAKKLGYADKSMIAKIESGKIDLPQSKIIEFSNALGVSPSDLMGWTDDMHDTMQGGADDSFFTDHPGTYPVGYQSLPILGAVSCGVPRFKEDEQIGFIKNGERIRADFCVIAKGDSMIGARIYNGDIVFVRKQPTVENGEIAVVCIEDEALIKTVYHYKDKEMLVLRAENRDYEDLVYSGMELEKIKILGKVVASQIDFE